MVFGSCTDDDTRYGGFDEETCSKWDDPDITINELLPANSRNASNYTLSGNCNDNSAEIRIYIESRQLDEFPRCQRRKWQTTVDLTGIIYGRGDYQVALSAGGSSGRLCVPPITNNFLCPDGYIGVGKLEGFTDRDFCVMKYEARTTSRDSNQTGRIIKAEAKTNGNPITRVTETEATRYCRENGAGHDLINNNEWQTIARSIEIVDTNWSRNRAIIESGNRLNIGSTGGIRNTSDDTEECDKTNWSYKKRSHKLSNEACIWDFSGHLWEIVKMGDSPPPAEKYSGFVYEMPIGLKQLFGPRRDYKILQGSTQREGRNGLGRIYSDSFRGALIRGGSNQQSSGIFSADTTKDSSGIARQNVGFRCVYHP